MTKNRTRVNALLAFVFLGFQSGLNGADQQQQPVPDSASISEASSQVRDLFSDEIADAKRADKKKSLARKMLKLAEETNDDPASRYALLSEARRLAIEVGDTSIAIQVAKSTLGSFDVDPRQLFIETLGALDGKVTKPGFGKDEITRAAVELANQAAIDSDFASADDLIKIATAAVAGTKDATLKKSVKEIDSKIKSLAAALKFAEVAKAALDENANDPVANTAYGRYLCFVKGDWEMGIFHLSLGDGELAAVATGDKMAPKAAADQAKIADTWWTAAGNEELPDAAAAMKQRAAHWYRQAIPQLTGLARNKAEKRVIEVEKTGSGLVRISFGNTTGIVPGLRVLHFERLPEQEGNAGYVHPSNLRKQVGDPSITTENPWAWPADKNAIAFGFIKIDKTGEYWFDSDSFYDRNALFIDGKLVCGYRGEVGTIFLKEGLVPIASVGYVDSRGGLTLSWKPAGEHNSEPIQIPAKLFFHDPAMTMPAKIIERPAKATNPKTVKPLRPSGNRN